MKRKLLSLALSMALLISLVSVGGFSTAAESVDFGSKAWENFENMTEEQASTFLEKNMDLQNYSAAAVEGAGEDGSKGLVVEAQFWDWGGGWMNNSTPVLDMEDAVGMRIWYKVETTSAQQPTMRMLLKRYLDGNWTDIGFVGTAAAGETVAPGTYAQTILFSDFASFDPTQEYKLGFELNGITDGGMVTLTIDNIEFIYYGDVGAGDRTDLDAALEQYASIYNSNNQDGTGDKLYSDTSYAAFKEAYEAARDLPADATQTAIDSALRRLEGTFLALEQLKRESAVQSKPSCHADENPLG